jgi:O-antigen ligase
MNAKVLAVLFALAAVAPVASTVPQFHYVFTGASRWAFLFALFIPVLLSGYMFSCLSTPFGILTAAFAVWCLLTAFWSDEPWLTMSKSFAMGLTALTLVSAGMAWAKSSTPRHLFAPLIGFVIVAMAVVLLGIPSDKAFDIPNEGMMLFQGAVTGSNLLGIIQAMAIPFLAWRLYVDRRNWFLACFFAILLALTTIFCLMSGSRGALIAVLFSFAGFTLAFGLLRFVLILIISAIISTAVLVVFPAANDAVLRVIYKSSEAEQSLFYTRQAAWEESWEKAKRGGAIGAGFGVSIDSETFDVGLTAVGYGREKGNSQLAIAEELGTVGLIIYGAMLLALFIPLLRAMMSTWDPRRRIACGIVLGSLVGILSQSLFEAWFVAPGAPESSFFWTLTGLALGLAEGSRRQARAVPRRRPIMPRIRQASRSSV